MVDCGNWSSYILQTGLYIVEHIEIQIVKIGVLYEMN